MARSMINQGLYLQREATPGVPLTTAMQRVLSIHAMPGWTVNSKEFLASGQKVVTANILESQMGTLPVETIQDFNGALWTLCGGFGAPVSTLHTSGTLAHDHTFTLNAGAADPFVSFTAMWGDTTTGLVLQTPYLVFNELGLTVQRGGLAIKSAAISQVPLTGFSLPTTGITQVPAKPISGLVWDVYADDTWAALGTTKLLACYHGEINFGTKYVPDYVINSAQPSFSSLMESDKPTFTGKLTVGLDAAAIGLVSSFTNGALKFFRFKATGPLIETTIPYTLTIDFCAIVKNPGAVAAAPNSPAVTLPFDLLITPDAVSGNTAQAVLTNGITALV